MGNLFKPQVKLIEKDGQLQVVIDLNLNLNINSLPVNLSEQSSIIIDNKNENKIEEKTEWVVPEFSSPERVKFGKKE